MDIAVLRIKFLGDTSNMSRAFTRAQKLVTTWNAKNRDIGKVVLEADTRKFEQDLDKASKKVQDYSKTIITSIGKARQELSKGLDVDVNATGIGQVLSALQSVKKMADNLNGQGAKIIARAVGAVQATRELQALKEVAEGLSGMGVFINVTANNVRRTITDLTKLKEAKDALGRGKAVIAVTTTGVERAVAGLGLVNKAESSLDGQTAKVNTIVTGTAKSHAEIMAVKASADLLDGKTIRISAITDKNIASVLPQVFGDLTKQIMKFESVAAVMSAVRLPALMAGAAGLAGGLGVATYAAGSLALGLGAGLAGGVGLAGAALGLGGTALYGYSAALQKTYSYASNLNGIVASQITNMGNAKKAVNMANAAMKAAEPGSVAYKNAQRGVALAEQDLAFQTKKMNTIFQLTTPSMLNLNKASGNMQIALMKVGGAVANQVAPSMSKWMNYVSATLPKITPQLISMTSRMNKVADSFLRGLTSGVRLERVGVILNGIKNAGVPALQTVANVANIAVDVFSLMVPSGLSVLSVMSRLSGAAARWTSSGEGQQRMATIWANLKFRASQLWTVAVNLGVALHKVFRALNQSGVVDQMMIGLVRLSSEFREGMSATGGWERKIREFGVKAQPIIAAAGRLVKEVARQFFRVVDATTKAKDSTTGLNTMVGILNSIAEAAEPIADALIQSFEDMGPIISKLIPELAKWFDTFAVATPELKIFLGAFGTLLTGFNKLPQPMQLAIARGYAWSRVLKTLGGGGVGGMAATGIQVMALRGNTVALRNSTAALTGVERIGMATRIKSAAIWLGMKVKMIAATVATAAYTAAQWLLNAAFTANPIGILIVAIAALAAGLIYAYKNSASFRKFVKELWGDLKQLRDIFGKVATAAKEQFGKFVETTRKNFKDAHGISYLWSGNIRDDVSKRFGKMKEWVGDKLNAFKENTRKNFKDSHGISYLWSGRIRDDVSSRYKTMSNKVGGWLKGYRDDTKKRFNDAHGISYLWSGKIRDDVSSRYKTMSTKVGGWLKGYRDDTKKRFNDAHGISYLWSGKIRDDVSSRYKTMKGKVSGWLQDYRDDTKKRFNDAHGISYLWSGKIRDDVSSRYKTMKGKVSGWLGDYRDDTKKKFNDAHGISYLWSGKIRDDVNSRYNTMKGKVKGHLEDYKSDTKKKFKDAHGISYLWSGNIRDDVTNRLKKMRENVLNGLNMLKEGAGKAWDKLAEGAGKFADKMYDLLKDGFYKSVNRARWWLGALAGAVSYALDKLGVANDLKNTLSDAKGTLQKPIGFARGGLVEDHANGGMGTTSRKPRMHVWNEQRGGEAFIAQKRPAKEQLPYLEKAAGWHGYAVVPSKPTTSTSPFYRDFAEGGVAGGGIPTRMFAAGGIGAMYNAVKDKFGIEGFNRHTYLSYPASRDSLDFMVTTPGNRAEGSQKSVGDNIASFVAPPSTVTTIWYGQANYGGTKKPYSTGPGMGNSNTLGHYDHVHAQAFPDQFKGAQGNFQGTGGTGGGGVDWVGKALGWFTDKIPELGNVGFNPVGEAMRGMVPKMKDWGIGILKDQASKIAGNIAGAVGKGASALWGGLRIDDWITNGLKLGGQFSDSSSNHEKMKKMAYEESGYKPNAIQGITDANGGPGDPNIARGLLQIIPTTWAGNTRPDIGNFMSNWDNPIKSVAVSSIYQKRRYGYIVGHSGYADGGVIPGRVGQRTTIAAHAGERVLPVDFTRKFESLISLLSNWRTTGRTRVTTPSTGGVTSENAAMGWSLPQVRARLGAGLDMSPEMSREWQTRKGYGGIDYDTDRGYVGRPLVGASAVGRGGGGGGATTNNNNVQVVVDASGFSGSDMDRDKLRRELREDMAKVLEEVLSASGKVRSR